MLGLDVDHREWEAGEFHPRVDPDPLGTPLDYSQSPQLPKLFVSAQPAFHRAWLSFPSATPTVLGAVPWANCLPNKLISASGTDPSGLASANWQLTFLMGTL